jgi:hypothetical protein
MLFFAGHHVLDPRVKTLPCTDEPLLDLPVLLAPNVEALPLPNTWSQHLSTSALVGLLPDIAVTHLMNSLFEPVALSPVLDVPLVVSFLLALFLTANAEVTRPLPLDAVMRDTAVAIARIANAVVITFFLYIDLTMHYY